MTKTPITTASTNVKRFSRLTIALRRAVFGVPTGLGLSLSEANCVPLEVITNPLHFCARVLVAVLPLAGVSFSDSGLELSSSDASPCFSGLPYCC